jgi:hypothetical protein
MEQDHSKTVAEPNEETADFGKYAVLINFADMLDEDTVYIAGKDLYPRDGYTPDKKRLAQLKGSENAIGKPLIGKAQA